MGYLLDELLFQRTTKLRARLESFCKYLDAQNANHTRLMNIHSADCRELDEEITNLTKLIRSAKQDEDLKIDKPEE